MVVLKNKQTKKQLLEMYFYYDMSSWKVPSENITAAGLAFFSLALCYQTACLLPEPDWQFSPRKYVNAGNNQN